MKIAVLGWYNHANVGDEAFKVVFPKLFPGHDLHFVESISGGEDFDALVLGGGDVVYPSYTRFVQKFSGKPKIALSVTITANSDVDGLKLFDHVYVRDNRSLAIAQPHTEPGRVSFLPDSTFALVADRDAGRAKVRAMFDAERGDLYEKLIVMIVSSYASFSSDSSLVRDRVTFEYVAMNVAGVLDNTPASILFVPFSTKQPHDDRGSNAFVAAKSKYYQKNHVIYDKLGVQDTLDVIAAADAVVSTRFHGTVFATVAGVPFVDLTHHDKNLGYLETIGKTNWSVPFWEFSPSRFKLLVNDFITKRSVPDGELADVTYRSRQLLAEFRGF